MSAGIFGIDCIHEETEIYNSHEEDKAGSIYGIHDETDTIHIQRYL